MMNMQKNAITIKRALLIFVIIIFALACFAGCGATAKTSDKTEGAAESSFRKQMASANAKEIVVKKDLVLEAPVEVNGTKVIYGEGSITAAGDAWAGNEYMIVVQPGAQLTVKGSVLIDADGITGGIHAAKDAVWTIEETASVKNASAEAANTWVEGMFQMNGGIMADALGHNIYNMGETTLSEGEIIGSGDKCAGVYSEGTLTQNGGSIRGAYNNVAVQAGSFKFNGGTNQESVRDGIFVAEGAKLSVTAKEATITASGVRGIYLCGEATIENITLSATGDSLMKISKTGNLNLSGGTFADSGYHSIESAGKIVMTGGTIRNSYNCGIVNMGTLEITGGSFLDNVNNKAILNKHDGKTTISGPAMFSGNRFAIGNEDQAVLDLSKAEILLTTGTNVYAYGGTVNIHDISLGASNSNNVRIYEAEVTMSNVQILGNSKSGSATTHGILLEGGKLDAKDITIKNVTGYGIRNKGGHITAENVIISKSSKAGGICNANQDYSGLPGVADVKNLTIEESRYNNVVVDSGTLTITDAKLDASGTNNVKVTDGTLNLKNVDVLGNQPDVDGTNHVVYSTGGTIEAEDVLITGAKVSCLRMNGETAVFNGKNVIIEKSGSGKYGIDISKGQINIDGLTMADNHYNIVNNGGDIKLRNSSIGPSVSNNVRNNKGTLDLRNVVIKGHTPDHPKNVHALFVDDGSLTGSNITVQNVANVGLRVKKGNVNLRGLTVNDAGVEGVWADGGTVTIYDLTVKKAGGAGVSATNTAKVTVDGGDIKNTSSHGAKSENSANLTLKNISVGIATTNGRHAVLAQGGDIYLENVKITGNEKNTEGFGIRINKDTSHVSGKGIEIADVKAGINASAGTSDIFDVTTENITSHSAYASGTSKLVISDSQFGASGTNNAKAENGGTLTLNNTVINGTVKNHGIMVENGGYFFGKDITVRDTAGCAVRVKCGNKDNTVQIDGLVTENIGVHNVYINKDENAENLGSVTIKNADLCQTSTHSVLAEAGNLTLTDAKLQGHLEGTANNIHAVYVANKIDKVKLENVNVLASAGDALRISAGEIEATDFTSEQTGRHGVFADGGKLTAENITLSGSKEIGVRVTGEAAVQLDGAAVSGSGINNISVIKAELTVNGYADGTKSQIGTSIKDNVVANNGGVIHLNNVDVDKSAANNIVTTGGKVYVTDSSVTGGDYSVLAQEGAYAQLNNVTITDPAKDAIRVNKADGTIVVSDVQIINPIRYGISAQKGTIDVTGALSITSNDERSGAIYVHDGAKVTTADAAAIAISGTQSGISVESNGSVAMGNVTISDCAKYSVKVTSGTAVLNGITISESGTHSILVTGGELTVNGYADGSKSRIGNALEDSIRASGEGVVRLNNVNVLESAKNNVVAIDGGKISATDSSVVGGAHSVLAQDGEVTLDNVIISNSTTSAIRANRAGSAVEATNVVINGAKTGLSISLGNVQIDNIKIRNTAGVGVNVTPQGDDEANVTLKELVAENCGSNAIYTSGKNAKLTVNGASLSNDGSAHVVNLNGGPMVLNDVAINGENLAEGKNELYSGAGWLTIGGAMDADVYIATGRVIKVNKELTGDQLSVDWANMPTGNVLEFADEAMMDASKDNIRLGATQSAASGTLYYYSRYAKLVTNVVTSEAQLNGYLTYAAAQNMADVTVRIGASFTVSNQVSVPTGITAVTIVDDGNAETGNAITYSGSTDGLFAMRDDLKLTVSDISLSSTSKILLKQASGTTELNAVSLSGKATTVYVTGGTMTVNGAQIAKTTADNIRAESDGVVVLNDVDVLGSNANSVVAINGGTVRMSNSSVTGGKHSVLADNNGAVYLSNVQINDSVTSGIRANSAGSVVEATDVTIVGAKTGLSIKCGTITITNITIRNTTDVGVSVAQGTADANVTLNNLVTENCGTNAIYTSGAAAKLTINGATLGCNGSAHVINLNGGPMVLNDVTINGENLSAGQYELYSGAGFLTIGGAMDADIYIATDRVVKVNKELTGDQLSVDWKNAPSGNAFEFADETMMEACKDNIALGKTQTDAGKLLRYYMDGTKAVAVLVGNKVMSAAQLDAYLTTAAAKGMTDVTVLIGGNFTVSNQVSIPAGITSLTICDDGDAATGNTVTYSGSVDGLFAMRGDLKLTVNDISLASTSKILLKQASGTTELNAVSLSGKATTVYVTGGTMTVNGAQIAKTTADNIRAESNGVVVLNDVDVLGSNANSVVAINGGTIHMADSSVTGGNHSVLAENGAVYLSNVQINDSVTSGIRANKAGSLVEATDLVIDGAAKGLSIKYGTVNITNITIRNTTGIGVDVRDAASPDVANVTLTNLVTENCGSNAIYTSGANANLTINGATLSNNGSAHVVNLNGGPMALNDVTINGANLASGKYELYSGAGWLTIGGAMDADIYIATGRVVKVNKELSGNDLVLDWKTAPTGNALEFTNADVMEASMDNITLGSTQSTAGNVLYTFNTDGKSYAKLINSKVSSQTQLSDLLNNMAQQGVADVTVLIGGSFDVANQVSVPAGITSLTICDDGNAETANTINFTANVEGMFNVGSGLKLTVKDISLSSTKNVLLKQSGGELIVDNCTLDGANKNILQNGGSLIIRNSTMKLTTSNNVTINDELVLEGNVLVEAPTSAENVHGFYINKGDVTINGNVSVTGAKGSSIQCGNDTRLTINETAIVNINGGGRAGLLVGHRATVLVKGEVNIANTTGPAIYVGYWNDGACSLTIADGGKVTVGKDANGNGIANVGIKIQYTGTLNVQPGGSLSVSDTSKAGIDMSGSGVMTLAGNVSAGVISAGRPVEVTGELTGTLTIKWTTVPAGSAITFASEAVMNAFKNAVTGGKIQITGYTLQYSAAEPWQATLVSAQ